MKTKIIATKQQVAKTFGLLGLFMILSALANPIFGQSTEREVSGVVSSVDGPLPEATIILKGTSHGVSSDEKGEFTFPVELKENDVLVFSYLGFETNEVTITNETSFIKTLLNDIPIIIVAALRTKASSDLSSDLKQ